MKTILLTLSFVALQWFLANPLHAQTAADRPEFGILAIVDETNQLNYNQLFKKVLEDNPALLDNVNVRTELVEHYSQAKLAVAVKFQHSRALISFYKNGKPAGKDTIALPQICSSEPFNSICLNLVAGKSGPEIASIPETGLEYEFGLRQGDLVKEINGIALNEGALTNSIELLERTADDTVRLRVQKPETGALVDYQLPRYPVSWSVWARPLQPEQLEKIFTEILLSMCHHSLGLWMKNAPKFNLKAISKAKNQADQGKCQAFVQMPVCNKAVMHPIAPGMELDSIFNHEKFNLLKPEKKAMPGDAALNVMRYYNFKQRNSYLMENDYIDEQVKRTVSELSGPFYQMPGVFANYFIGAYQYELAGNYSAALNQYYSAYFKTDDMIASTLVQAKAKKAVLARIAHCSQQMNQPEYALLSTLAQDCLDQVTDDPGLQSQDKEYYDFVGKVHNLSHQLEDKLADQRAEKRWAIVGAIANVGMSVATFNLDANLSANFFIQSMATLSDNADLNYQINSTLAIVTGEIALNLPPELQEDERNPYELVLTEAINFSLEHAGGKLSILRRIAEYSENKPALKQAVEQTRKQYELTYRNMDHRALIAELAKTEQLVYRYEKRGLIVPTFVTP